MSINDGRVPSPYTRAMDGLRFTDEQRAALKRALLDELRQTDEEGVRSDGQPPAAESGAYPTTDASHGAVFPPPDLREERSMTSTMQTVATSNLHLGGTRPFPVIGASTAGTAASAASPIRGTAGPTVRRTAGRRVSRRAATALLAAAAVAAGIAGAALATGIVKFDLADIAAQFFGATPSQSDAVNRVGQTVGVSATDNGVTVSLDAIIGDRHNVACVFSIYNEDGSAFDATKSTGDPLSFYFTSGSIKPEGNAATAQLASSASYAIGDDRTVIQAVFIMSSEAPLIGNATHARFSDLMASFYDAETGTVDVETVAEGTWDLEFTIDYEDASVELTGGQTVSYAGIDATIAHVELSPVGLTVELEMEDPGWGNGPDVPYTLDDMEQLGEFIGIPISLTLTDGTEVDLSWSEYDALASLGTIGGWSLDEGYDTTASRNAVFDRIYDLADIASVTVGDVEIPVG